MSTEETRKEDRKEENRGSTAVDLAKQVIDFTSVFLGELENICSSQEEKEKAKEVLLAMQRRAMDYLYRAAKRASKRSMSRGNGAWRRRRMI